MKKVMRKIMKKTAALSLTVIFLAGLLCGCGSGSSNDQEGKVEKIKKAGVLVMGTASGYPPYEFVSMENDGEVIGIDVAFGQAIADELGVELKVEDMAFGELITALSQDKCDIAIAGMTTTPERAEAIDFSDVYITDKQCMIVKKENVDKYHSKEDFSGKTVGVEKGSSSEEVAGNEIPEVKLNSLSKITDLFLELKNGKIDGIVTSRVVGRQYVIANEDLGICEEVSFENSEKKVSCGIAKGNGDFVEVVNKVIKECQDSGKFDEWIDEYSQKAAEEAE